MVSAQVQMPMQSESSLDVDVLVVGGGINGAGIARDLAGRGWRVMLVEKDDLAAHTSSSSTKLIHGGLRYLEHKAFGLVRKALQEREVLLRSAPHIMRPLRFVMPHDAAMRPAWLIRLGLFFYDHLAKREWLPASGTGAIVKRVHFAHGGNMTELEVKKNGVVIHDKYEIPKFNGGGGLMDESKPGAIYLQDHGNPVRYRNIWFVEK